MFIIDINQEIGTVKNILIDHKVVVMAKNVHDDLVAIAIVKNDHIDLAAVAKGIYLVNEFI